VALGASLVSAGVIRHDVPDSDYTDLAVNYPSVGALWLNVNSDPDYEFLTASGVLIDEQWVLTAAHVVLETAAYPMQFAVGGQSYDVVQRLALAEFDFNPYTGYDLGLLRLAEPVDNVTPSLLYGGSDEIGQDGTIVGFGQTGNGLSGAVNGSEGVKRAGQNTIDVWLDYGINPALDSELDYYGVLIGGWPAGYFPNERIFLTDFDAPDGSTNSIPLGSAIPLELEYMPALGDSGGAVFIEDDQGREVVAGIVSAAVFPNSPDRFVYGDLALYTRVSEYRDLIYATIPEPGSVIVWSLLIGLTGVIGWRRRAA